MAKIKQPPQLEEEVDQLAQKWRDDTLFVSSVEELTAHPAYQRIIGLGNNVIPILLRRLRERPEHWFSALAAITGQDPVPADDRGDVRKMAKAWIAWGKSHGYLD